MLATVNFRSDDFDFTKMNPWLNSVLVGSIPLSRKSWWEPQTPEYRITWKIYIFECRNIQIRYSWSYCSALSATAPAYEIYIFQVIRYCRACGSQGYARIILSTILNLRIISIKRFFSRVHACVPMHSQTLYKRPSLLKRSV
jgi:hypothetical protein